MTKQHERRQFWRAHFHSPVQLAACGKVIEADLYDISLKGALLKVPENWAGKVGEACQVRLSLGPEATISMHTTVSHIDGRRIGLHCDTIDIDSVTHLRRLVELNAGDPGLLERELSELLNEAN